MDGPKHCLSEVTGNLQVESVENDALQVPDSPWSMKAPTTSEKGRSDPIEISSTVPGADQAVTMGARVSRLSPMLVTPAAIEIAITHEENPASLAPIARAA